MNIHIYGLFQDRAAFVRFVGTADGRDDGDAARAIEDAVRDELYPPSVAAWMNFIKAGDVAHGLSGDLRRQSRAIC